MLPLFAGGFLKKVCEKIAKFPKKIDRRQKKN